jgi:hypothetical protein
MSNEGLHWDVLQPVRTQKEDCRTLAVSLSPILSVRGRRSEVGMDTASSASAYTSPACQRFDASALPTVRHDNRLAL